jgi:hypothetical protein
VRKLILIGVVVLVLAVVAVVLDRLAVSRAENELAVRAQRSERLPERPAVSIRGFPFLTQAVRGRYSQIDVTVRGLERDGLRIEEVRARLLDVEVELADVLDGAVRQVPVARAAGSGRIGYADLNRFLGGRFLQVAPDGTNLRITGSVRVAGRRLSASAAVELAVTGQQITLRPRAVDGATGRLPGPLRRTVEEALTVRLPVRGLPFGVSLQSAQVRPDGLLFTARGDALVLESSG